MPWLTCRPWMLVRCLFGPVLIMIPSGLRLSASARRKLLLARDESLRAADSPHYSKSLTSSWSRYYKWVTKRLGCQALPATYNKLSAWAQSVAGTSAKKTKSIVQGYKNVSALCGHHDWPCCPSRHQRRLMRRFLKGLEVIFPSSRPRRSVPIQARHIVAMRSQLHLRRPRHAQFWAQLLLSHALMMRGGELCALAVDDVRFPARGMVEVTLRGTKTNRGQEPFSVWLAAPKRSRPHKFSAAAALRGNAKYWRSRPGSQPRGPPYSLMFLRT